MDFLRMKWAYWFTTLDTDHDGLITRADVDKNAKDFPTVEGLSESEGRLAGAKIIKWWTTYILKSRTKITKNEFLQGLENQYRKNQKAFTEFIRRSARDVIGILDIDNTNFITLDNYVKAYKVCGHYNEQLLRKAFELYKPAHGKISIEKFTEDWVTFLTNDDPSKPDVVLDTYKIGIV